MKPDIHAVTGPFSYTGRYIARRLEAHGLGVRGFVRKLPDEDKGVDCRILQFEKVSKLTADLEGVRVLYNTYWVRIERGDTTFAGAVENTGTLARAAKAAGVERIVHISVSNPGPDSPFAYFRGKAAAEDEIRSAGLPYSIIRPTLVFGQEDILINNIAWMLRRFHVFPIPGAGTYRVQPVYVDDVAGLSIAEGKSAVDRVLDAAGPETLTFRALLDLLRQSAGVRAMTPSCPPRLSLVGGQALSIVLGDVVITNEELGALMAETLVSSGESTCSTPISQWLRENGARLGTSYSSEYKRHWSERVTS